MNQYDPITRSCIWFVKNRQRIEAWAYWQPTIGGITYSPKWVESTEVWVDLWRQEYKKGVRESWLFERYLDLHIRPVKRELERIDHALEQETLSC